MDTLEKYVCIGGPPSSVWTSLVFSSLEQFKKSWYIFFFQAPYLPEINFRLFDMILLRVIGGKNKEFTADDLEAYKYTFRNFKDVTGPINYYRNISGQRRKPKLWDKPAPGLFLLGEGDLFISKDTMALSQKRFENLSVGTIKNANHFSQQDNPEETNRLIREFLAK